MERIIRYPLLLLLISLFLIACQSGDTDTEEAPVKPVKVMVIQDPTAGVLRNFPGKVLPTREVDLAFEIEGRIIELPINEGEHKTTGTLLAKLDPEIYANKVGEAEAKYELAKAQLARGAELIKNNFMSQAEYDILHSEYLIEEANLRIANRDLRNTVLYAPFDGIVARKYVDNFQHIAPQERILSFHDLSYLDIEVYIPEYLVILAPDEADPNNPPVAVFDTLPNKKFPVEYKEYSAEADPETQAYRLVLTMPAPDELNVLPGMTATVQGIIPSQEEAVYSIPVSAVFSDENNQTYVWRVDGQTMQIHKVPITISQMTNADILVTSGIEPGNVIVTAGVHFLQEGQKVRFISDHMK